MKTRSWIVQAVGIAVVAGGTSAKLCTTKELAVFDQVDDQVKRCAVSSGLSIQMPPSPYMSKDEQHLFCDAAECFDMLDAVDALDIPRCDVTVNNRNVALQTSMNRFASLCDDMAPPSKKHIEPGSGSSSESISQSSDDDKQQHPASTTNAAPTTQWAGRLAVSVVAALALQALA